jgi:SAM-dependent methyltransferase
LRTNHYILNRSFFNRNLSILLLVAFISLFSCLENPAKENNKTSGDVNGTPKTEYQPINPNENKDRDVWQKPNIVIDLLGDLSEKTVADIGAGTGYFTFRFALKAKKVIAIDIESRFLDIINTFKTNNNLPSEVQQRIETRLAKPTDPLLQAEEADLIVIINTIGEIHPRKAYLKTLLPGLKKGGQLVIVDYKMKNLPLEDAPPKTDRVPLNVIEKELEESGYVGVISNDTSLDYQYIVFASRALD